MSYRNQYSGSPWQQGGPPFGVGNYGQSYGGYNDQYGVSHQMMNTGYNRSQGSYGGMYGSGMGQMRSMGYGPSQSRHYMNDRMGGRQIMSRGQMQRKRLPQRSPAGGPRSKRPNLGSDSRRLSKPRRRRESRGGSKGRGRDHSDDEEEDEAYNPAEPTDDASDVECDGYESWKSSTDEEGGEKIVKEPVSTENGEENMDEAGDKDAKDVDGSEKSVTSKKHLICYVCKVTCSSQDRHRKHQSSKSHTAKIEALLAIRREKNKPPEDDEKASSDKDGRDSSKKKSRKPGNWCTVCECPFSGNFLAHRRTKEHRKKRDKKYPKCRPCRLGFSSSEEYRDHYKSEDHKQRSAEFHYLKNLASGSDDDEAAIEPMKIPEEEKQQQQQQEEEEAKMEEATTEAKEKDDDESGDKEKAEDAVNKEENDQEATEKKSEDKEKEKDKKPDSEKDKDKKSSESKKSSKPKEPKAYGQSFVVSVQGYYCKLCHKFFKDVTVAKSKHCRSIMHTTAFKKAMEDAVEQEEERQKLADEQDKIDREAAEAAELAAEIVAIERAAKEAAKKEAAAKKAEALKDQDVEMKDVDEDGIKKEDSKGGEKMDSTSDGIKVENGIKDQNDGDASCKSEKDESATDDKPATSAEAQDDSGGEDDGDEEKIKEEITPTASKRGRGRGRGRKRR